MHIPILFLVVGGQVSLFHHPLPNASAFQQFGFSSVPPPDNSEKNFPPGDGGSTKENSGATAKASGETEAPEKREALVSKDSLKKLTMEVLVKLVTEKVELLKGKHEEIEKMQHTCADMVKPVTQKEVLLKGKHKEIEKCKTKFYALVQIW
ncbi:hypothetical protein RHSIM_Rhsim04G0016700 [Rhododendron simsii]|uniref:Uncharacterized protein n=1 Tax=Rhododendron simsii TaxID=118357 RepID=A0A834GZ47_RHOSS|nr:hypothetical protein RHSIM_Rhsim04G0016700 [Rhododendron simsii]